ncbi:MAG: hypothetical protein LBI48_12000 [Burkholderiaceae bacterium]|jgi:hypothetical protein|nr:hypothetical protein [Burkholderiaceae bacterium]
MLKTFAPALWMVCCAVALPAVAQQAQAPTASQAAPACPAASALRASDLYGAWRVELPQVGLSGTLTLSQHPEFSESLRGRFSYGAITSIASGDVEDGEFNLDESRDGKALFAFWSGRVTPQSCGKEIRGRWEPLNDQPGQPPLPASDFVLRRQDAPANTPKNEAPATGLRTPPLPQAGEAVNGASRAEHQSAPTKKPAAKERASW